MPQPPPGEAAETGKHFHGRSRVNINIEADRTSRLGDPVDLSDDALRLWKAARHQNPFPHVGNGDILGPHTNAITGAKGVGTNRRPRWTRAGIITGQESNRDMGVGRISKESGAVIKATATAVATRVDSWRRW